MANLSISNMSYPADDVSTMTLDKLLYSIGFKSWQTIGTTFVLSLCNFFGLIFCSISAWIFFDRKFKDSIFFYFRLLTLVFSFHLLHNIPFCILFSPKYFPSFNTYKISIFQIYYNFISSVLFQYEEILQIFILLTRMKTFNKLLKKYFNPSPILISILAFLTCLIIYLPIFFTLKITSLGDYVYTNLNGSIYKASFYYPTSSEFTETLIGQLISLVTYFILGIILSLIIGLALNIVSFIQFREYLRYKRVEEVGLQLKYFDIQNSTRVEVVVPYKFSKKRLNERKREKQMLYLILTLCSISILTLLILMFNFVYFIFYYDFQSLIVVIVIATSIYTITPTVAIFIFHSFNKDFRNELKKIISFEKKSEMKCMFKCFYKF